jgi:tetratricopeptide (TPR) repeat protein
VPDTVQTVLMARIDRLAPAAKRLLQVAAVIGTDVPFSLLRAVAGETDEGLDGALSHLLTTELMYETPLSPGPGYTFKHALTHEVAYGSLLHERRRALHARVVEAMEAAARGDGPGADRIAEQVDQLGHHALRGHLWDKAVAYLRRAGRRDGARPANRQAVASFEGALEALRHLPDHRDARELAIDIRLDLRNVQLPLDELAAMFGHLQTAEALATALDDRARLGWVSAYLAAYYRNAAKPREAEAAGRRAMAIADERADLPLQVMAHFLLGLADVYACRFREAIGALRWNVDRLRGEGRYARFGEPGLPAVHSRSYLIRGLAEVGDFEEGLARGDEAVRLSESTDLPFSLASALEGLGYVRLRRGELPQAIGLLERGLRLCEQRQFRLFRYTVQAYLGSAYAPAGRDAEAAPLLAASAAIDWGLHPALRVTMQGEAHRLAGRREQARRCAERGLALAAVGEEHGSRGWTLRPAAELALDQGPEGADHAAAHYREALALAAALGMRPLQAHCHLGLGRVYRRTGRVGDSRADLAAAVGMLTETGMTHWLPGAEAELARATASGAVEQAG